MPVGLLKLLVRLAYTSSSIGALFVLFHGEGAGLSWLKLIITETESVETAATLL